MPWTKLVSESDLIATAVPQKLERLKDIGQAKMTMSQLWIIKDAGNGDKQIELYKTGEEHDQEITGLNTKWLLFLKFDSKTQNKFFATGYGRSYFKIESVETNSNVYKRVDVVVYGYPYNHVSRCSTEPIIRRR